MDNIFLDVDGKKYTGWKQISVQKSLENFCGQFSFQASALDGKLFPITMGSSCKIWVNDTKVLTGWVEKIQVRTSADNHEITVSGRDITNDIIDSQISHPEMNPPVTLKQVVERVLKELGITEIRVIDRFNLKPFKSILTDGLGNTAFDFIESYARERQILLTTNADGNIVFERAADNKLKTILSTRRKDAATILNGEVNYDDSKRFHIYNVAGQQNNAALAAVFAKIEHDTKKSVHVSGNVVDNEIRKTRKLILQTDTSDSEDASGNIERAKWEANYRRTQSFTYSCDVQGFKPLKDEGIWLPNYLVTVIDEYANLNAITPKGIHAPLLISEVNYSQSVDQGTITKLKLVTRDAFTTRASKPPKETKDAGLLQQIFGKLEKSA